VKVANFFTKINHTFCKHNTKQSFQTSSPPTALKWSQPEGYGQKRKGWRTGIPSHN